jgi:cell division protein FtsL
MNAAARWSMPVLWVLLLASAVAVIWTKHQARSLFIELQTLHGERDRLDTEWGQLKLEQSAFSGHGRVEQTARAELQMIIPRPDEVLLVKAAQ